MKEFLALKILDKFKRSFNAIGIDYVMMRKILQVKFTMDGRRVPTIVRSSSNGNSGNANTDQNSFVNSLWIYVVIGIIMFMVMSSLISDFSVVLLDIRDSNIIGTKPISSETLGMAKTTHIFIYMFLITISITGPSLVISFIRQGALFFVIFICEIVVVDLFIVVLTAMIYLLILRFFDGEKLKDIINYVQIGLSIAVTLGYQLIARLFQFTKLDAQFTPKWWQYFIVPVWFGGPFELLIHRNYNINFIAFTVLAMIGPIISIIIYIKLMPSFERDLQKLSTNVAKPQKGNKRMLEGISRLICSSKEEKLFFKFASDMMKNEREFKLKVYPTLGFAIVLPFIFLINAFTTGDINV